MHEQQTYGFALVDMWDESQMYLNARCKYKLHL